MNPTTPRQDRPECVCTLEDAVLAAMRDLREKGRSEATYGQILYGGHVGDWLEEHGMFDCHTPIMRALDFLVIHDQLVGGRHRGTWSLPE